MALNTPFGHQRVNNRSLTAPSPVTVHSEYPPASYTDDLGITLGGPVAASVPLGDRSLPRMSFSDLTMVRFFESSGGRVPDSFSDSSHACVI